MPLVAEGDDRVEYSFWSTQTSTDERGCRECKSLFVPLMPIDSQSTVERYSLLFDTKGVFKMAHIMKCVSIVVEGISKIPFVLLMPINSQSTAERYSLLSDTKGIFKMAHIMKCDSIVVEGISKIPFVLLMPINGQGTVERYNLLFNT